MTINSEVDVWPGHRYDGTPGRRKHREKLQTAPFVAWDGEGYTDETGKHHYMLFGSSDGNSVRGDSLSYTECFPLLLDSIDGINVIYGGDYDVIMMTRDMPYPVRKRLLAGRPVKYDGYRMVWYRRKMFHLKHYATKRSTVLYDVLTFFQCSFVNACKEYLGDSEELDAIHKMKLKRDSFTLDDETVGGYWQGELEYLVRLANELRRLLTEVGIKPKGWYGPGAVASGVLTAKGMKRYIAPIPPHIVDIAERAYYGGRFEQFKVGKLDSVYEYDIRSAYPWAIAKLPNFYAANWNHFTDETVQVGDMQETIFQYGLYCVSWDIPFKPWEVGPLPWRSESGNIYFPLSGHRSWYWGIELQQTLGRYPRDKWTIHELWAPYWSTHEKPFSWVADMYDDRARMKAEGNPAQKALKLAMNSLYGKLVQSVGSKYNSDTEQWRKPPWHNILAGGFITAATRAKIYQAIAKHKPQLVAIETDAVFMTEPMPHLSQTTALGDWEETNIERILYVHSGVYYALRDGVWKLKSRGVEADKTKSADHWLEIFGKLPHETVEITTTLRRFGTDIRQPDNYSRWYEFTTSATLPAKNSKRVHVPDLCVTCLSEGFAERKFSYADCLHYLFVPDGLTLGSGFQESTPYKLPWRDDANYDWPSIIRGDVIEDAEGLVWQ